VMDWDLDEALRRVHQSNLSKLDDEGKPVLRADGKVMKGPNYQPPDLSDLVCLK
jgi:predicted HAD superfamily Cof-like phosphohydrolase